MSNYNFGMALRQMSNAQNSHPHLEVTKDGERGSREGKMLLAATHKKACVVPRNWTKVDNQQMRERECNKYKMTTFRHAPAHFSSRYTLSFIPCYTHQHNTLAPALFNSLRIVAHTLKRCTTTLCST